MGKVRENLDGGLVDGPDPAQLSPGQLSDLRNCVYYPTSQSLQRSKGQVGFGTATSVSSTVNGLRDVTFDNSAGHYLIAQVSGAVPAYVTAFVGDTGTFGILTTGMTAGASLEVAHYNNRFFLLNGVTSSAQTINSNGVFYLTATAASSAPTIRQHGMIPVTTPPGTATAAGAFSLTDTGASGFYEYWTTEVFKGTQDGAAIEIESTFAASGTTAFPAAAVSAMTVYVPDVTTTVPVISMPPLQNLGFATHWRVYRSPRKTFSTDVKFPIGFRIAEMSTASSSVLDTNTKTVGSYIFPASANSGSQPYAQFTNASGAFAVGGSSASATVSAGAGPWGGITRWQAQGYYGFNFGGFNGPVQGIEVQTSASGPCLVTVALTTRQADGNANPTIYGERSGSITAAGGGVLNLGSSADKWSNSYPFTDTDFDGNFMAIMKTQSTVTFDYIKVRVNYGAADNTPTEPFPTIVYTFSDQISQVGKNGMPPTADTGDVYEDSLVLNDKTNPSLIRWSFPGLPEYFPSTYFLDFETRENDIVRMIKVVNNRLIVALDTSVWRVNYLPSERDASFDRGKAFEPLNTSYGCINPMCACIFSPDNAPYIQASQHLAWVSQKGIHITDGYSFKTLTNNINWRNILSLTSTSSAIALINDAENQELLFLYRNDGFGNESYRVLHLSYAAQHIQDNGRLKISGQVNVRHLDIPSGTRAFPASIWSVRRDNGDTSIYMGYGSSTAAGGGLVYRDAGVNSLAGDARLAFTTRRMFLAGEGQEFELHSVYGYIGSNSGTAGIDMQAKTIKTNDDAGEVSQGTHTIGFGGRKLGKWQYRLIAEGLRLSFTASGSPSQNIAWDYILLEGENFGTEDSGK